MAYKSKKKIRKMMLVIVIAAVIINFKPILRIFFPLEYEENIVEFSQMYNVDPNLVAAVINTESEFKVDVHSSKGAVGLMQIMPETGDWIAGKLNIDNYKADMLGDPIINIQMGTWYLNNLSTDFNGDYTLILASYNGGPGNVTKWLKDEKYSKDGVILDEIPFEETEDYVKKVEFNHRMYRYLYGLEK